MDEYRGSSNPVFEWLHVLDDLSYYELFGIPSEAQDDELHAAFHQFCDTFHPDRHVPRPSAERAAILTIFRRGTEAYLVLSDARLRAQYDAQLGSNPEERPPRISHAPRSRTPQARESDAARPGAAPRLEDAARSPSSRPFARRAEELIEVGDLRQAKLQLVMANHLDPGNAVLEIALRQLEAWLAGPK